MSLLRNLNQNAKNKTASNKEGGTNCFRIYRMVPVPKVFHEPTGRRVQRPASVLAPGSALGSVPTVALSSVQAERIVTFCIQPEKDQMLRILIRILFFRNSAKNRKQELERQDARENYSESDSEVQVFCLPGCGVG